jgi:carbon storage regulator CsrA
MLVLSRLVGQNIVIRAGDLLITVRVCGIQGRQVRVGVDAPMWVAVDREEVDGRKQAVVKG